MTRDLRTRRDPHTVGRFVLVGLVLPIVVALVAAVAQLMLLPRVPATVATHWNASGTADGFGPAWLNPLMTVVLGIGIPALLALTALPGLRRGDRGPSYRLLGALSAGTGVLLSVLLTWTLVIQVDATDPASVTLPFWPVGVGIFALSIAAGTAAWFVQPREDASGGVTGTATAPLALAPGERAVWMRTVSIARPGLVTIVLADIVVSGIAIGSWFGGAAVSVSWLLTGVALLLLALTATTVSFHVRVDADGLTVESVLGVPRVRVPLDAVEHASAIEVNPMGQFGGWGLRLAVDGRFGVVLRTGPALQVARAGRRPFVVTVDDAATGAALLEALARRARGDLAPGS